MEKDRATEYWDNEIKRAAEDTVKAYMEFLQAQKEEFEALNRQLDAEENDADAETKEEAREIHIRKSIYKSQKWETYLMVSKWDRSIREAAEGYKKRKAEKEANKQEPTQSKGRRQ